MSFTTQTVASALLSVVSGLSAVSSAQIGAPESVGVRVAAYITLGSQQLRLKAAGLVDRDARYLVTFVYRVDGAETTAETTLMDAVDALLAALYADMTLGGTCRGLEIDAGMADDPDYRLWAGKEYREYPVIVSCRERTTYEINP